MHELGMCEGVVAAVERRARGRPVARVGVRVGTLLRIAPEAFQQSFTLVAAGGVAADATTELTVVPVRARCRACDFEFETVDPAPACPDCVTAAAAVEGGDELVLEWIEYAGQASDIPAAAVPHRD